jgi:uncharacterized glyoxalase superfamily protein PhnB
MPGRQYAVVERDAVALHLFKAAAPGHSAASILFTELESRGALVTQGIERQPWGNREFRVADPGGNTIKFTEPV